ncbi:MAG TPA: hypothetical protein VJT09_15635 [Pyrinomonadaceae bacterium]|nr:hypothetical protein [Pyrinomonadaceae bacterium]
MKKILSLALVALMIHAASFTLLAGETRKERMKRAMLAAEVKTGIAAIGTGKSARVRVLLTDKTRYHGYVTEIGEDHFVVADAKTGVTSPIAYAEVAGIKGNNLSTGAKIGIGVAVAAAVVIIAAIIASSGGDDQKPSGQIICVTTPCP